MTRTEAFGFDREHARAYKREVVILAKPTAKGVDYTFLDPSKPTAYSESMMRNGWRFHETLSPHRH